MNAMKPSSGGTERRHDGEGKKFVGPTKGTFARCSGDGAAKSIKPWKTERKRKREKRKKVRVCA